MDTRSDDATAGESASATAECRRHVPLVLTLRWPVLGGFVGRKNLCLFLFFFIRGDENLVIFTSILKCKCGKFL